MCQQQHQRTLSNLKIKCLCAPGPVSSGSVALARLFVFILPWCFPLQSSIYLDVKIEKQNANKDFIIVLEL